MKQISSSENRIVKEAVSLLEKKYRDRLGLYLIEGPNIIGEALARPGTVRTVFLRADAQDADALDAARTAEEAGIDVCVLSRELFSRITDARTPQCIAAEAFKPKPPDVSDLPEGANVLVLDRLQDPGNVGTLIRTAEAMGFSAVMLVKGTADPWQPKAVRSAAGSLLRLPLLSAENALEAAELLGRAGKTLYTAAAEGDADLWDLPLARNAAVVIGNEGAGASEEFKASSRLLRIPMAGGTESLNAAAAGAVIMYESLRQKGRI